MNARVQALIDQARIMTAEERLAALDALQELVAPSDQAWEGAWALVSEDRVSAYQRGEIKAEDFDVFMGQMRQDYLDKK